MAFMLKITFEIKEGQEDVFKAGQEGLCAAMAEDHPGVLTYLVEYETNNLSHWVEIYANDSAWKAHLGNEKAKPHLDAAVGACDKIICRCFGSPNEETKEVLAGFGATYEDIPKNSFVLNPAADKDSPV